MAWRCGIGQDSHRFLPPDTSKPCVIGGLIFEDVPGFKANSDGDVVLHAICNAISSVSHVLVLGGVADELCLKDGITDSEVYVKEAVKTLGSWKIENVALSIEAKKPKMKERFTELRENVARILEIDVTKVGVTATSGEGLTDFGCGDGVQCFCTIAVTDE